MNAMAPSETCPSCKGTGRNERELPDGFTVVTRCPDCKGTGLVRERRQPGWHPEHLNDLGQPKRRGRPPGSKNKPAPGMLNIPVNDDVNTHVQHPCSTYLPEEPEVDPWDAPEIIPDGMVRCDRCGGEGFPRNKKGQMIPCIFCSGKGYVKILEA